MMDNTKGLVTYICHRHGFGCKTPHENYLSGKIMDNIDQLCNPYTRDAYALPTDEEKEAKYLEHNTEVIPGMLERINRLCAKQIK